MDDANNGNHLEEVPADAAPAALPSPPITVALSEYTLLVNVVQRLIQVALAQQNPPRIITATNQQEHKQAINTALAAAIDMAVLWGLESGVLAKEPPESPSLLE